MSDLNVVDSSGWLEYLLDSDRAPLFADAIEDTPHLIVPVIIVYEVYKKTLRDRGEDEAREAALAMQTGRVIDLDTALALEASRHSLPLADSLIYATTLKYDATLWTQDEHFKDLPHIPLLPQATRGLMPKEG